MENGDRQSRGESDFPILPDRALSPLARWLSKTVAADFGDAACVRMTLALAVHLFDMGHTCLVIGNYARRRFPSDAVFGADSSDSDHDVVLPDAATWRTALLGSGACGAFSSSCDASRPLMWHEDERGFSVALTRHASREIAIAKALSEIAADPPVAASTGADEKLTPEQNAAVAWAMTNRFTVISGGPGTGKTTTVATLVARLAQENPSIIVKTAAPSGKAAARMTESFNQQAKPLRDRGILPGDYVVGEASTLHRLLGVSGDGQRVARTAANPIPADVVIIDEASMVSSELMKSVLDALAPACKLVLLGDMNQLKSVEPGNVLGTLCRDAKNNGDSLFKNSAHLLKKSFRFSDEKNIGRLAAAIVDADKDRTLKELRGAAPPLAWKQKWTPSKDGPKLYESLFKALRGARFDDPISALEAMEPSRILCSQNCGRFGSEAINQSCSRHLAAAMPNACDPHPVMILENDYEQNLFNGDTGVVMKDPDTKVEYAFFRAGASADALAAEGTRKIPVALLPAHAAAYAMTVHKAQGSEYSHLALILPPYETPVLSRSLLYTAVTRFRESPDACLLIAASEEVVRAAVGRENEFDSLFPAALALPNLGKVE